MVLQESKHIVRCSTSYTNKDLFLAQTECNSAVAIEINLKNSIKSKKYLFLSESGYFFHSPDFKATILDRPYYRKQIFFTTENSIRTAIEGDVYITHFPDCYSQD